jgi:hypothetical protein
VPVIDQRPHGPLALLIPCDCGSYVPIVLRKSAKGSTAGIHRSGVTGQIHSTVRLPLTTRMGSVQMRNCSGWQRSPGKRIILKPYNTFEVRLRLAI